MILGNKYIMINVDKIFGSIEVDEEINGVMQTGVFIPYEDSMKTKGRNHFLCFNMRELEFKNSRTHALFHLIDKIAYNNLKRLEVKGLFPLCGYGYKDFDTKKVDINKKGLEDTVL